MSGYSNPVAVFTDYWMCGHREDDRVRHFDPPVDIRASAERFLWESYTPTSGDIPMLNAIESALLAVNLIIPSIGCHLALFGGGLDALQLRLCVWAWKQAQDVYAINTAPGTFQWAADIYSALGYRQYSDWFRPTPQWLTNAISHGALNAIIARG